MGGRLLGLGGGDGLLLLMGGFGVPKGVGFLQRIS